MKINKGPVLLVLLALAADMAYIALKGSKEVVTAKPKDHGDGKGNNANR